MYDLFSFYLPFGSFEVHRWFIWDYLGTPFLLRYQVFNSLLHPHMKEPVVGKLFL